MILGIGIDIVEIHRIHTILKRQPQLLDRIFTEAEKQLLAGKAEGRLAEYVAGRFAAKEAGAKALGTGIGGAVGLHDIQITPAPTGKPEMTITDAACSRIGQDPSKLCIHLSITHSKEYAAAQVVIESKE
ncbi:holo-ACP synthase [Brevibacillus borstelensis]|uniref:holo-ACP synthase n=1 Tax=Brevibacillus borstelensis TaxID=45462 RepID=UPI0030C38E79